MQTPVDDAVPVRLAGPQDEHGLIELCRLRHQETGLRMANDQTAPFAVEKVRETVHRAILTNRNHPDAGQAWIGAIGEGRDVQAAVYLTVYAPWDCDANFLMALWHFVLPEYRKSSHSANLITFAKAFSRVLQIPLLMEATEAEAAKSRIIERNLKCRPFGNFYLYQPEPDGCTVTGVQ